MSLRTDLVNLIVNIKGDNAKNELNQLQKEANRLGNELKNLKKGTKEYTDTSKQLSDVKGKMGELTKQIGITAMSQKQLMQELRRLQQIKAMLTPQTEEFTKMQKEIDKVSKRLYEVKNGVFGFSSTMHKLKKEIGGFGTAALAALGFQFITDQFRSIIQGAGKLSDSLAGIRKSTGLTDAEVKELNKSFSTFNTRTTTEALREIAKVGGQMGIAKEQIGAFTQSMDNLNVALGDEFEGGAEQITNVIGKLRNTFSDIKSDNVGEDLLHIGNALNVLGAEGLATAPVVSDIAQRIGSAGQVYGMTAGQTLGLSASLQELGITAERGGTATVKIMQKIATAPGEFAKIAGMGAAEFTRLVNTDITKAFMKVAEGFNSSKGMATEFAEKLADAEIGSVGITEVLSKLGSSSAIVADKINLSTEALKSNTSITEEFNILNSTLGATLDKLGKEFYRLVTSPALTEFLTKAAQGALKFIQVLRSIPEWFAKNATQAKIFIGVMLAFNALRTAALLQQWIGQLVLLTLGMNKSTLSAKVLATATRALQLAYAAAIGAAVVLIYNLSKLNKDQKEYVKSLTASASFLRVETEARKRSAAAISEELAKVSALVIQLRQHNITKEKTAALLKELIAINPELLKGLTAENIKRAEGIVILQRYKQAVMESAIAQAKQALLQEKMQKAIEFKLKYNINDGGDLSNQLSDLTDGGKNGRDGFGTFLKENILGIKSAHTELISEVKEFKKTLVDIETLSQSVASTKTTTAINSNSNIPESVSTISGKGKTDTDHIKTISEHQAIADHKVNTEADMWEKLRKLREDALQHSKTQDEREVLELETKFKQLYEEAGKNIAMRKHLDQTYALEVANLQKKQAERHAKEEEEQRLLELDANKKYLDQLYADEEKAIENWYANEKEITAGDYSQGLINKSLYEETITALELKELVERRDNAIKFGNTADVDKYNNAISQKEIERSLKKGDSFEGGEGNENEKKAYERAELAKQARKEMLNAGLDLYRNYIDSLNAMDEQRLKNIEYRYNQEQARLSRMLKYNMISKAQFDKLSEKAEEKANDKKKKIVEEQFYRSQKLAATNALINGALAISDIWSKHAANPVSAGILTALAVANTGAQISTINSQEPPIGRQGLIIDGPSHEGGGVDMVERRTGKTLANVEGGEPLMVLSKNTMANNGDVIRKLYHSSRVLNGAPIDMPNASRLTPILGNNNSEATAELKALRTEMKLVYGALAEMPKELKSYVVLKDLRRAEREYDSIKKYNSVNQ